MSDVRFKGRLVDLYARAVGELAWLKSPPKRLSRLKSDKRAMEESSEARSARVRDLEEAIPHIGATLQFVMPEVDLAAIKPIRPSRPDPDGRPPQGILGAAFNILQDATAPLTIKEIVEQMADLYDLDISTVPKRQRYHTAVNNGLKRSLDVVTMVPGQPDRFQLRSD